MTSISRISSHVISSLRLALKRKINQEEKNKTMKLATTKKTKQNTKHVHKKKNSLLTKHVLSERGPNLLSNFHNLSVISQILARRRND